MTLASVRQLPGIHKVSGDWAAGTLIATYDPTQVTPELIVKKIEAVGFSVESKFQP